MRTEDEDPPGARRRTGDAGDVGCARMRRRRARTGNAGGTVSGWVGRCAGGLGSPLARVAAASLQARVTNGDGSSPG